MSISCRQNVTVDCYLVLPLVSVSLGVRLEDGSAEGARLGVLRWWRRIDDVIGPASEQREFLRPPFVRAGWFTVGAHAPYQPDVWPVHAAETGACVCYLLSRPPTRVDTR